MNRPRIHSIRSLLALAVMAWALAAPVRAGEEAEKREATDKGFVVPGGALGQLILEYPEVVDAGGTVLTKRAKLDAKGPVAELTYENGGTIRIAAGEKGTLQFTAANFPAGDYRLKINTLLPFTLAEGGTYRIDDDAPVAFPATKPEKPQFFQNQAKKLVIKPADGDPVTFTMAPWTFTQLQDNREWNWSIFALTQFIPLDLANPAFTLSVNVGPAAKAE